MGTVSQDTGFLVNPKDVVGLDEEAQLDERGRGRMPRFSFRSLCGLIVVTILNPEDCMGAEAILSTRSLVTAAEMQRAVNFALKMQELVNGG